MTTYVEDDNGGVVSETCMYHCAPGLPAPCDGPECQCGCHRSSEPYEDPELTDRARAADDREPDKLAVIANELDRERYDVEQLMTERFGRPRRSAA